MPEIVIVGAGPAGLSAAKYLAEADKDVLVLEKNKKPGMKICAAGITSMCFDLGIPESILERKFKNMLFNFAGIKIKARNSKASDLGYMIYTTKRTKLGSWQAKLAKKAGAKIKYNANVTAIGKNFVKIGKKKIPFKYLIGADGSNSIVRKYLRLKSENMAIAMEYLIKGKFKDLEVISGGLFNNFPAWLFPYKKTATVGSGYYPGESAESVKNNLDKLCKKRGYKIISKLMVAPINYSYKGIEFGNKFLAGDAAGLAFDLTGEGISAAIISGQEVAKKILDPKYNFPKIKELLKIKKRQKRLRELIRKKPVLLKINSLLMPLWIRIPGFKLKFFRALGLWN